VTTNGIDSTRRHPFIPRVYLHILDCNTSKLVSEWNEDDAGWDVFTSKENNVAATTTTTLHLVGGRCGSDGSNSWICVAIQQRCGASDDLRTSRVRVEKRIDLALFLSSLFPA
jgi:hypothetical protein